jgi:hypothetical protein
MDTEQWAFVLAGTSIERTAIPRVSQRLFDKATEASFKLSLSVMAIETLTLVIP